MPIIPQNGSAHLISEGFLTGIGDAEAVGSAALASSGTLLPVGLAIVYGSAALGSSGSTTATGAASASGIAPIASSGTLGGSGDAKAMGSAALASEGFLSPSSSFVIFGSASMVSGGSVSGTGDPEASGSNGLVSLGSLAGSGIPITSGSASMVSGGSLTPGGSFVAYASAALASEGFLAGAGSASAHAGLASLGSLSGSGIAPASGSAHLGSSGLLLIGSTVAYNIYSNNLLGGAVDYSTPIGTTSGLTFTTSAIPDSSDATYAVRAFDVVSGLEEKNVDCRVRIVTDASGVDVTNVPVSPTLLGVIATASGHAIVDWLWLRANGGNATSFDVYLTAGSSVSYASPAATVSAATGQRTYSATVSGLSDGVAYVVAVRAFNATGHDSGTSKLPVIGSSVAPSAVQDLTGIAVITY